MKIDRALRIKRVGINEVNCVLSFGRICKSTFQDINKRFAEVLESLPNGTPEWVKWYLKGRFEAGRNSYYEYHLEWCYRVKGKLYSTRKASERYYEKHGITLGYLWDKKNGHYWLDSDRPFNANNQG